MMVMKMVVVVMMEGNTHLLRGVSRRQSSFVWWGMRHYTGADTTYC